MSTSQTISNEAKEYVVFKAVSLGAVWFAWPLLWYLLGLFGMLMILGIGQIAAMKYAESLRRNIQEEITSAPLPFRRYAYGVSKKLFWIVSIPQLAGALWVNGVFVWVISGLVIVIGGALLLHDWQEMKDLEANNPNPESSPAP